ncbi:MAG: electron transport complex subunit RsxC, partial [Gammaproteobacteria bacterium]|nr:electron transport complex subunit RsxC [Gammaproteobacteria bacterium]
MLNLLNLFKGSFNHGVHPNDHKIQTVDLPIQRVPFGSEFIMPLGQHIGAPARAIVKVGDQVERGQLIAEATAFISSALHSPVTGTVKAIEPRRYTDGSFKEAIVIKADKFASQQVDPTTTPDPESLSIEQFIEEIQRAGIVGMGGAAFPSHVKYSIPEGQQIDELLVNGAECEPYLTNDHRLMVERPNDLLRGIEILRRQLGAKHATIGVESNKPESIAALENALSKQIALPITVTPLEVKYPQGAEKMLIKSIYDREVPAGELPRNLGISVNNVGTIIAIADYFDRGMPLIERIVTVAGPGIDYPANLIVPLGTTVRDVLKFCGGLKEETHEVIMGGPMMGVPIASLDAPILKGTSGILAFTAAESGRPQEYPCIHCGRCLEACPYFLNPSKLARLGKARMYEEMGSQYHVMDCVECGACTFASPSNIPIVQHIRSAKD